MTNPDNTGDRDRPTITRRRLLAAAGAAGVLGSGASYASAGTAPAYTHYTYAQTTAGSERLVRVAWYETYNGQRIDRSNEALALGNQSTWNQTAAAGDFVDDPPQPLIDLGNVLPGDHGSVVVGLHGNAAPAAVWLQLMATQSNENGRNEPEQTAGDTTPDIGELVDALQIRIWYDSGVAGLGACNGRRDLDVGVDLLDEPLLVEGSLRTVGEALANGVPLATSGTESERDCLGQDPLCLGLEWSLDADVDNTIQSDSVAFDLSFAAATCEFDANPFGGEQT
ncbi:hypothetical protein [Halospeciosus flavus]|uniref:Uncharacterized protein n=1 Tax=Halospeciosus flavus TaxID=3032283 RepID=A0ABD5Z3E3_9EURY|nr:hypothetical protein [Halospeciosus flavus]